MTVYADNAATTKMSQTALNAMLPAMEENFGNPSSLHSVGQRAAELRQEHEDMERAKDKRETAEEREARLRRDKQREEMRRQRERDLRLKQAGRRTREEREKERDISERIALGQVAAATATGVTFDSRLFDQNGGVGSGYADDEGRSGGGASASV